MLASIYFSFFLNSVLAKESMPSLCGLWLKTIKYLKSFVSDPFFSGLVGQAAQPAFGSLNVQN